MQRISSIVFDYEGTLKCLSLVSAARLLSYILSDRSEEFTSLNI